MTDTNLLEQADQCRQRAHAYLGRPEATFLLRTAQEFERLAWERRTETKLMGLPPAQAKEAPTSAMIELSIAAGI